MLTHDQVYERLERIRREHFEQGDLDGTLNGYQGVLADCEKSGAEDCAFLICYSATADVLYELGRRQESFEMYDRALGYSCSDPNEKAHTLMNKGISLVQEGDADAAKPLLREAVEISYGPLRNIATENYRQVLSMSETSRIHVDFDSSRRLLDK